MGVGGVARTSLTVLFCCTGLAGGSSWQTALVDQVVDSCDDLRAENAKIIHERDKDQAVSGPSQFPLR